MPEKKIDTPQVSSVGGLNGLIRRMTGFKENKSSSDNLEKKNDLRQKSQQNPTERDDESKLDIPAFLRRQAN
jgi:cell division protein FtsZ